MTMPWEHKQFGPNGDTAAERAYANDLQSGFVEIPTCIKRDANNRAPFMDVVVPTPWLVAGILPPKFGAEASSIVTANNHADAQMPVQWPDPRLNPEVNPPATLPWNLPPSASKS